MDIKRILAIGVALSAVSNAAIVGVELGRSAPPPTLGPYEITALPFDTTPIYTDVTTVPGNPPLTGDVTFDRPCNVRQIGSGGWMTWSHGYTGKVYYTNGYTRVKVLPPTGTAAFLTYVEINPFSVYEVTVTANDDTSITQDVAGASGAAGFGFYGTDGSTIDTITISSAVDFAFGEFYGAVPEPGTLGLLGLGALALIRRRSWKA